MFGNTVDFLFWDMPWWGLVIVMLFTTQCTIAAVTLYLHRSQTHLALELHNALNHFFRMWLWLTTAMVTSEWVAIHRKHHARCETEEDPHSPVVLGMNKVLLEGAELYSDATKDQSIIDEFERGTTPNDWIENKVYKPLNFLGIFITLAVYITLFGPIGITMWAIQMMWIPVHAAGVINGLGHGMGYRNWECKDAATNLVPWGVWIGGEELHNNHHAFPSSAKFSAKPWEFDIGWMWIQVLSFFGLAKVKKTIPKPIVDAGQEEFDIDNVRAILRTKMHVMADYANGVIKPVLKDERDQASKYMSKMLKKAKRPLIRDEARLNMRAQERLAQAMDNNETIKTIYEYRQRLIEVWNARYSNNEGLLSAMREWIQQAEQSGIEALEEFAEKLKGWQLPEAKMA